MKGWLRFAELAEAAGIESVLISFSRYEPDPLMVSCSLGRVTRQLKFIVAYRSGLMQPATFVQQVNTLSTLIDGRVAVNIVAGSAKAEQRGYGDFLAHDDRYARADEFLAVCHAFWRNGSEVDFEGRYYQVERGKLHTPLLAPGRSAPEIYISGHSERAEQLAIRQGSCLLRVADTPENLQTSVARARSHGLDVCLRFGIICRPTREEAVAVAESLMPDAELQGRKLITALRDDSQMHQEAAAAVGDPSWPAPWLWAGLVPYFGPVWTTILGTPEDIAAVLLAYKRIGVSQFIMSGWPEVDELSVFSRDVLPLVRSGEVGRAVAAADK
jgi:alkanesulfonate monooxygenase